MMMLQKMYSVTRNWAGDPCSPKAFAWDGVKCSDSPNDLLIITALNLSYSGLIGGIDDSFGQLTRLQHCMDLSHNNLSGPIPDFLCQMQSLTFLDLSSNNLSGIVPLVLLRKSQYGGLTLRIDNNPNLCGNACYPISTKNKSKIKRIVKIVVPILGVSAVVALFVALAGGFGPVYFGCLENGTSVAIKMRSQSSSQGNTEFLAEAQHLSKVHHRNLVSFIGYCNDMEHLGLVYEYMAGGNLDDRLTVLEYLHKSCSPPLIHRDVKTRNILLTENLRAKISDFGLKRAFNSETKTHITTEPAGTLGYLDPEYYATSCLSEKSDVYSFGVVLLVLITAQTAVITDSNGQRSNIGHWVRKRLSEGDIESVTDPRIREDCNVNSAWKVVELVLYCTEQAGRDRPTMTEVVEALREILQLETSRSMGNSVGATSSADATELIDLLEAEHIAETQPR
ncbi:hypothetical protein ACP4OV_002120 [Aristida adscensionis]